jgi:formate dehydrogenase iron-sulfur subunit
MKIGRRDFLKVASAGSVSLVAGNVKAESRDDGPGFDDALGVLVDTVVCIGCRNCERGCNQTHDYLIRRDASEFGDQSVFERHRRMTDEELTVVNSVEDPGQPGKKYYMKVQCMHCNDPACVSACLVSALRKSPEGPVTWDAWRCMGCRYCLIACPFDVPAYEFKDPLTPDVRKCDFCFERTVKEGKKPGCVEACPNEALTFGKRGDLLKLAYSKIKQHPDRYVNHVYGEHEAGGTSWLYLAGVDFTATELPSLDSKSIPEITESIQHNIFKAFVSPIALYGLLGLVMYTTRKGKTDKGDEDERS